ncbi:hypothetical protein F442_11172 [Phytophthora nicotianae P10297]|uniref:BED-type domain-containing protein n=1 Tax=Phytophthora nicotianae P10297 TaxID=1317064 RepID=W2Z389_PHYNI|nr:hypothetical protein F442_11172 [Phytophthora nicotianae P10297]
MNATSKRTAPPTNKQLTSTIFSPAPDDRLRCRICAKHRSQANGKGYTNLVDHLRRAHSQVTVETAYKHILQYGTASLVLDISPHAKGIHDWIE